MSVLDKVTLKSAFPSWRELLSGTADRLECETKNADAGLIRSFLNVQPPRFLDAAKHARQSLGTLWYEFLKEKLDIQYESIDPSSLELARSIWRLGSNLVLTTNYDEVLKWACPWPNDLQSWDIEAPVEQAFLLQQRLRRPVIWHLHGHISKASQIILSPDGYELLYPDASGGGRKVKYEAALKTLQNQITAKSLLFIGFSLDDQYFGFQLKSIHKIYRDAVGPHYALVREEHAEGVRNLGIGIEPVTFSDFGEPLLNLMAELESFTLAQRVSNERQVVIPDYGPHRTVFYVPFKQKGDEIVGQQQVLDDVRKQLTEGKRTAIGQTAAFRGLGGLGKTQLAIEYAYRYRDEYPNGVIWINADQDIDAQLIEIAERGHWIAPQSEHKYKIQIAQQRIRSYSDCLLVFDNLEDIRDIESYLPELDADPHILVTSRTDHAAFHPVPLDVLDRPLSRELLLKEADRKPENDDEEEAVWAIVGLLGGLPLALELAGAYLAHRRAVNFRQYYELLSKDLKTALPKNVRTFTRHEADLYNTLRLSEDLLQKEDHLREILDLLTWSGSAPMSTDLISTLLNIPHNATLVDAVALGAELRLLQPSKESESYSIHRLVSEVRRAEISLEERLEWVDVVCRRLGDWFEEKREDFSQLTKFESEIDHLRKWQENAAQFATSDASKLMWLQAYPAYHRGRYVEAKKYLIEAQRIFEESGAANLELKANLLNDCAYIDSVLGDYGSVLANHMEALKIRREFFGDRHRYVAASLGNIARYYGEQGSLEPALAYSHEALDMQRELLGEPHREIANTLTGLGHWYGEKGDLRRAVEYLEQSLTMRRQLFGELDPTVAVSLGNLGRWYGERGNVERGLEFSQQALSLLHKLFGERHPDIAALLANIGSFYGRQGDFDNALELLNGALTMNRELFGERHPGVAVSLHKLGYWYRKRGELQNALQYSEQALTITCEVFGERHPSTVQIVVELAHNLIALNRLLEAYNLVKHFLSKEPAQSPAVEQLRHVERKLLAKSIRPGFRQPPKTRKRKPKKKRR